MNDEEYNALAALCAAEDRPFGSMLRVLIRTAARARGLLPPAQPAPTLDGVFAPAAAPECVTDAPASSSAAAA